MSKNYFDRAYYFGLHRSNYLDYRVHAFKIYWWKILKILKRYGGGSYLDIGCAFGYLVNFSRPHFYRVVGVDISEFAIIEAKKRFPGLEFCAASVDKLPFPDQEFDFITALDVLEHVFNISAALKEIHRVLKPGGKALFRMPYNGFLRKFLGGFDRDKSHISILAIGEYEKLIQDSDFHIEWRRRYFTPWGGNAVFLATKNK